MCLGFISAPGNFLQLEGFRAVQLKICHRLGLQHPSTSRDLHIRVPRVKVIFSVSHLKSSELSGEIRFSSTLLSLIKKSVTELCVYLTEDT